MAASLPIVVPLCTDRAFGAEIRGVDLNSLDGAQFAVIQDALYRYKVLVIKDQPNLRPESQLLLNRRFDPSARAHGAGSKTEVMQKKTTIIGGKPAVNGVDDVRILGRGTIPAGHFGSTEPMSLMIDSHQSFHKYPLTDDELAAGDTRFFVWHTDCSFKGKEGHCSRVTTFWAHTLPDSKDVHIRFDDETGAEPIITKAGRTGFIDACDMYQKLSPEDKAWVEHSLVEYAPNPFDWNKHAKLRSNGLGLDPSDVDKLLALEELEPYKSEDVQILPMLWPNPVIDGEKALMVHGPAARKLHYRRSPHEPFKIIDDTAKVWQMLYDLERPYFAKENILFSTVEEGDLAVWTNRLVRHSSVEYPQSYGPRIAHQCHLVGSDPQAAPVDPRVPVVAV